MGRLHSWIDSALNVAFGLAILSAIVYVTLRPAGFFASVLIVLGVTILVACCIAPMASKVK